MFQALNGRVLAATEQSWNNNVMCYAFQTQILCLSNWLFHEALPGSLWDVLDVDMPNSKTLL